MSWLRVFGTFRDVLRPCHWSRREAEGVDETVQQPQRRSSCSSGRSGCVQWRRRQKQAERVHRGLPLRRRLAPAGLQGGLLRSAPAEGLPRARRPESVERRRRGAFRCPLLRVPVPQRVAFSGSALAKPAPSRDSRVRRLQAGVVRAMRAIPGWPGTPFRLSLVSYRPLAHFLISFRSALDSRSCDAYTARTASEVTHRSRGSSCAAQKPL